MASGVARDPGDRVTRSEELHEVAVIGAGPAGCTAALHLLHRGREVILLDRAAPGREKVCGDALLPDAARCLDRLSLLGTITALAHRASELRVLSPSGIGFSVPGSYLTIRRQRLDDLLAREAIRLGAAWVTGKVVALVRSGDGWTLVLASSDQRIRVRVVLLATGGSTELLNRLGAVQRQPPTAVAARCYVRSSYRIDTLVGCFDRSILPGYAWVFPMGQDTYNIGCGVALDRHGRVPANLRSTLDAFMEHVPLAAALRRQATEVSPLRGGLLRCGLHCCPAAFPAGVLGIGEAIGSTLPFSGEGIGKAMETGELAAELVAAALARSNLEILSRFPALLREHLAPRYRAYEVAQRWHSHSWLVDLFAWRASRSPRVQRALAGIIAETVLPGDVFSAGSLLRSLWS